MLWNFNVNANHHPDFQNIITVMTLPQVEIRVETAEELCKRLWEQKALDPLGWLNLTIRLGINSHSSTEGCFSTTKDINKMYNARKLFVFHALSIVLRWCRDVVSNHQIQRKAIMDSFTVVSGHRVLIKKQNEASNGKNYWNVWVGFK